VIAILVKPTPSAPPKQKKHPRAMSDNFTEVTTKSWGSRLMSSITGVLFGIILAIVGVILLFWNEGRAIHTARALAEAGSSFVAVSPDAVQAANEGKMVYANGPVETAETLSDPQFGVALGALKLERTAETYQWTEKEETKTSKNLGGSEETRKTYTYTREWVSQPVDSTHFKEQAGHVNPPVEVAPKSTETADKAHLGAFQVPAELIGQLSADEALSVSDTDLAKVSPALRAKTHVNGAGFYLGSDPANAQLGDQRVSFKVLRPATVSLMAMQSGQGFQPYSAKSGSTVELIELGTVPAALLVGHAESRNHLITWLVRAGGFVLIFVGFALLFGPLDTLGDVVPFIGSILRIGAGLLSFFGAAIVSFVVIAVAWFAYRPLLSVALIAAAIGVLILWKRSHHKANAGAVAA
jgi:hypothetical protein